MTARGASARWSLANLMLPDDLITQKAFPSMQNLKLDVAVVKTIILGLLFTLVHLGFLSANLPNAHTHVQPGWRLHRHVLGCGFKQCHAHKWLVALICWQRDKVGCNTDTIVTVSRRLAGNVTPASYIFRAHRHTQVDLAKPITGFTKELLM